LVRTSATNSARASAASSSSSSPCTTLCSESVRPCRLLLEGAPPEHKPGCLRIRELRAPGGREPLASSQALPGVPQRRTGATAEVVPGDEQAPVAVGNHSTVWGPARIVGCWC
jgi:hypothetical protein